MTRALRNLEEDAATDRHSHWGGNVVDVHGRAWSKTG